MPADDGDRAAGRGRRGPPLPLWRADSVRQRYLPGTERAAHGRRASGARRVAIECAASGGELGCVSGPVRPAARGSADRSRSRSGATCSAAARASTSTTRGRARIVAGGDGRRTGAGSRPARPLGGGAPAWARRMYERSLLVLRALTDRRSGAVAAGARDGWAYVWPRDAGAVALALAAAGYRAEARRVGALPARPRPRRRGALRRRRRAGRRPRGPGRRRRLGRRRGQGGGPRRRAASPSSGGTGPTTRRNPPAITSATPSPAGAEAPDRRPIGDAGGEGSDAAGVGAGGRGSGFGLDSAAAWAVRPFPRPALFPAARRTLAPWPPQRSVRTRRDRFGIVPSEDWHEADPWTAPDRLERLEPCRPRRAPRRRWACWPPCAAPRRPPACSRSASTRAPASRARPRRSPGPTPSRCSPCASSGRAPGREPLAPGGPILAASGGSAGENRGLRGDRSRHEGRRRGRPLAGDRRRAPPVEDLASSASGPPSSGTGNVLLVLEEGGELGRRGSACTRRRSPACSQPRHVDPARWRGRGGGRVLIEAAARRGAGRGPQGRARSLPRQRGGDRPLPVARLRGGGPAARPPPPRGRLAATRPCSWRASTRRAEPAARERWRPPPRRSPPATTPGPALHVAAPGDGPAAQGDDRPAEIAGVGDLRQRPPFAADRDRRLAGGDDGEVARLADPGRDHVGAVRVRLRRGRPPAGSRSRCRRPRSPPAPPPPSPPARRRRRPSPPPRPATARPPPPAARTRNLSAQRLLPMTAI